MGTNISRSYWGFLLVFLFLSLLLHADISHPLNLDDVEHFSSFYGQKIAVRGFLYQSPDKKIFLAKNPDLKSCCVGHKSKTEQQLIVNGNIHEIPSQGVAVTVEGILEMQNINGQTIYLLQEASIVSNDHSPMALFIFIGFVLLCAVSYFCYRQSKSK